ncbi:MAG: hypothetical protein A2503_02615 [Burkholderiales bacterium RIFOXYD12_FULL_59_19]|nr:MAG: hypothetical protein A2503_02615 [Burkholderiales bacterium RIFOXYD12_FULL_59_19]
MTLLERALGLFATTQKSTSNFELLKVADIVSSISSTSNDWNRAAVLLAADHEQSPGKRVAVVCYPASNFVLSHDLPKMSTPEWNALALELLEKAERIRGERSDEFQGTLRDKSA